ncbi:MAG TPA: NADP-dependent malic enzyme [Candidatus Avidehalobacter gallistercoris]|uniref:NADP-dependent malic enzyme n=1 Tax=Candidatus Avidehalobacter gallistercoris TaxID=2840694 RepID=A0A9D1HJ99_9FIRM|nr:NADP-dependent malic enzyme [Candidatus Avidehalobacter gallistercoris]
MADYNKLALEMHEKHQGKIEVVSKVAVKTRDDLSTAYTPGVAEPCRQIRDNADDVYKYTAKGNLVAVVSDGSAVLGLGNIGAKAAIPVMEGKCILFKEFADVDAFPICVDTQDDEEIIRTVKNIAPVFGGVNLEDIAAPRCFEIERRLKEVTDIPIFHDDQHGTAVCVLAAIINAAKVVKKNFADLTVVINGCGAAGSAIARIILAMGVKGMFLVDMNGILNKEVAETMLNDNHKDLAAQTNHEGRKGGLAEALKDADVFVGVSKPGLVTTEMVKTMAKDAIIFAMANPTPEIFPEDAKAGGAAVVGTGRSDYPNQINNVLVFPGLFKGALAVRASDINEEMKLAAAKALAAYIPDSELDVENIIPSALDKNVAAVIAEAVGEAAKASGVARI